MAHTKGIEALNQIVNILRDGETNLTGKNHLASAISNAIAALESPDEATAKEWAHWSAQSLKSFDSN